jgi:hypothetical protein
MRSMGIRPSAEKYKQDAYATLFGDAILRDAARVTAGHHKFASCPPIRPAQRLWYLCERRVAGGCEISRPSPGPHNVFGPHQSLATSH